MAQNVHAGAEQFTPAEHHMALLARHGGVQITLVAQYAQSAVQRVYVVLDLRQTIPDCLRFVPQISALG